MKPKLFFTMVNHTLITILICVLIAAVSGCTKEAEPGLIGTWYGVKPVAAEYVFNHDLTGSIKPINESAISFTFIPYADKILIEYEKDTVFWGINFIAPDTVLITKENDKVTYSHIIYR